MVTLYLLAGIVLVVTFAAVIIYYFSPKRKDHVEAAKYEMLKDDDGAVSDDNTQTDSKNE